MSPEIKTLLLGALIGFLVTLLTTVVTHLLQLARDKKDQEWKSAQEITNRLWDKKITAYGNIINTLVEMNNSLGNWLNLEYLESQNIQEYNHQQAEFLGKAYRESLSRIEKAEIEGAYLISENTAVVLNKLVRTLKTTDGNEDNLSNLYHAAKNCLQIVRDEARKDLKIQNQ